MSQNSKELKVKYHKGEKPSKKKNPNVADMSKWGYRDDSPYNTMSYLDIYTPNGVIDMSETGKTILANGRVLPPYSGMHQFDTDTVREIPIAKTGGWLNNYLPKAQTGRYVSPSVFIPKFNEEQAKAEEYTDKRTGTTLKQRQDKAGINPNTGKPWATGMVEQSISPIDFINFSPAMFRTPGMLKSLVPKPKPTRGKVDVFQDEFTNKFNELGTYITDVKPNRWLNPPNEYIGLGDYQTGGSKLPSHLPEAYKKGGNMKNWLDKYQTTGEYKTPINPYTGKPFATGAVIPTDSPIDYLLNPRTLFSKGVSAGKNVLGLLNEPWRPQFKNSMFWNADFIDQTRKEFENNDSENVYQEGGSSDGPVRSITIPMVGAGEDMPEVSRVPETESFSEAFRKARAAGLKTFTWRGKSYGTKYKTEVEKEKAAAKSTQKTAPKAAPKKTQGIAERPSPLRVQTPSPITFGRPVATPKYAPKPQTRPQVQAPGYSVAVTDTYGSRRSSGVPSKNITKPAGETSVKKTLPSKVVKPPVAKKQNDQPANIIADKRDYANELMGSVLSQKNQRPTPQLPNIKAPQTGVIVDKRTGQAFVRTGDKTYSYPVLTGKNVSGNLPGNATLEEIKKNPKLATTPRGYYTLEDIVTRNNQMYTLDASEFAGGQGRWLNPISANGFPAHVNPNEVLGLHGTYDPKVREPLYNKSSEKRWVSSGCVNARECDIKETFNDITTGDTTVVIDSSFPQDRLLLEELQKERTPRALANAQTRRSQYKKGGWLNKYKS